MTSMAISFDEDLGNSTVASSIAQDQDGLEPKDRYLLTRSLPDFIQASYRGQRAREALRCWCKLLTCRRIVHRCLL